MGYVSIVAIVAMFLVFMFIQQQPVVDYNVTTVAKTPPLAALK
jgi:hypothetical protein